MASLFKRKGSRNWQIKFSVDTHDQYVSTRTPNRKKAEKVLARLEVKLEEGTYQKASATPLGEFLGQYFDHYKAKSSRNPRECSKSFKTVASRLRQFFAWLEANYPHITKLEQTTTPIIAEFLNSKRSRDLVSEKTYNHYRQALHTMFAYAYKHHGFVSRNPRYPNPVTPIDRIAEPNRKITFLTLEQIDQQLGALKPSGLRRLCKNHVELPDFKPWVFEVLQPMASAYIYGGFRREEVLWLTPQDVDLKKMVIRVSAKEVDGEFWQPKTKKARSVPISSALLSYLSEYRPPDGSAWFFSSPEGKRWNPDNFSATLREINRCAKLTWVKTDQKTGKKVKPPWGCQDFRHTFGSHLAMKGVTLYKISELLGNSPEVCRKHYAHLMPESLRDCVEFDTRNLKGTRPGFRVASARAAGKRKGSA